jgi:hypothetical protein
MIMSGVIVIPSINPNPQAIATMREHAPGAHIIVVGDMKSPPELREFCKSIDAQYLGVDEQVSLRYNILKHIPWNCIQRRSIGTLEAIRQGADFIISTDDDNHPLTDEWYSQFEQVMSGPVTAQLVTSDNGWFNLGDMANQRHTSRGFPYSKRNDKARYEFSEMTARAGIASGFVLGDPDINATERLEIGPKVKGYNSRIAKTNLLVDTAQTWTAINTQNTAYHKDLFPLAFVLPMIGRYDDIWAGYIAERVMEVTEYSVYFGEPPVIQSRNPHSIWKDLRDELMGMEYTDAFCDCLKNAPVSGEYSILYNLGIVAAHLRAYWPHTFPHEFLSAWISDVEQL